MEIVVLDFGGGGDVVEVGCECFWVLLDCAAGA